MMNYAIYVSELERLAIKVTGDGIASLGAQQCKQVLDGQPSTQLRKLVSIERRRGDGIFFTSSSLRRRVIAPLADTLDATSVLYDSSAGVADLLLEGTAHLPIANDFISTLQAWGRQLHGVELHELFVRASKVRLLLAAAIRCGISGGTPPCLDEIFPNIQVGDGLADPKKYAVASHIVLNPSFSLMDVPADCRWSTGRASTAAVFVEQAVLQAREGTRLVAILPDVLRSGTRYGKWRSIIAERLDEADLEIVGRFDPWTDIDVFILRGTVTAHTEDRMRWCSGANDCNTSVANLFDVSVGPVVPHRDPKTGHERPFIMARDLAGATEYDADLAPRRQYKGTAFLPPFVVVRRTSRPEQSARALGSIITGTMCVAVENHLIVLKPRAGSLEMCRTLLKVLHNEKTATWLNMRIRCRHLTVRSLRELPWWEDES